VAEATGRARDHPGVGILQRRLAHAGLASEVAVIADLIGEMRWIWPLLGDLDG
jgi:hypothetical protein